MSNNLDTPSAVRECFSKVLVENYEFSPADAEKAVSNWKYGKKKEVSEYHVDTYRGIFGIETGAISFGYRFKYSSHVAGLRIEEWKKSGDIDATTKAVILVTTFAAGGGCLVGAWWSRGSPVITVILIIFGKLLLLFFLILLSQTEKSEKSLLVGKCGIIGEKENS